LCRHRPGPATETFRDEVLSRETRSLDPLALECGYIPADLLARALFLFVTGQYQRYRALDSLLDRPLLARGYAAASDAARGRSRDHARKTGQYAC